MQPLLIDPESADEEEREDIYRSSHLWKGKKTEEEEERQMTVGGRIRKKNKSEFNKYKTVLFCVLLNCQSVTKGQRESLN